MPVLPGVTGLGMPVRKDYFGTGEPYHKTAKLEEELRDAVRPFPFRGLAYGEKKGDGGQFWQVRYKKVHCGRTPLVELNSAFRLLKSQQDKEKSGTTQNGREGLFGQQLRNPRLTYFAVNAVIGDGIQGDLSAAEAAEELHGAMFTKECGLWLASLQGKYGPWKNALWTAWQLHGQDAEEGRVGIFWCVLQHATLEMSKTKYQDWSDHCGKSVAHHSGFLKLLIDLGLVQLHPVKEEGEQVAKRRKVGPGAIKGSMQPGVSGVPVELPELGKPGFHPVWLSTNKQKQGASHCLQTGPPSPQQTLSTQKYLDTADALHSVLLDPPKTCQEYIAAFKLFQDVVRKHKPPHVNGSYTMPWTFRSAAFARMRHHGIHALSGAPFSNLREFAAAFPDQNDWLSELSSGQNTVQGVMNILEYKGPPELLTMKLCLHLEADLMLYNPEWLYQNAAGLHMGAQCLAKRIGFFPHIGVFLQLLRERWEAEKQIWPQLSLSLEDDAWMASSSSTHGPPSAAQASVPGVPGVPAARMTPQTVQRYKRFTQGSSLEKVAAEVRPQAPEKQCIWDGDAVGLSTSP